MIKALFLHLIVGRCKLFLFSSPLLWWVSVAPNPHSLQKGNKRSQPADKPPAISHNTRSTMNQHSTHKASPRIHVTHPPQIHTRWSEHQSFIGTQSGLLNHKSPQRWCLLKKHFILILKSQTRGAVLGFHLFQVFQGQQTDASLNWTG